MEQLICGLMKFADQQVSDKRNSEGFRRACVELFKALRNIRKNLGGYHGF